MGDACVPGRVRCVHASSLTRTRTHTHARARACYSEGNKAYQAQNYDLAIKCYTEVRLRMRLSHGRDRMALTMTMIAAHTLTPSLARSPPGHRAGPGEPHLLLQPQVRAWTKARHVVTDPRMRYCILSSSSPPPAPYTLAQRLPRLQGRLAERGRGRQGLHREGPGLHQGCVSPSIVTCETKETRRYEAHASPLLRRMPLAEGSLTCRSLVLMIMATTTTTGYYRLTLAQIELKDYDAAMETIAAGLKRQPGAYISCTKGVNEWMRLI